jgi:hypothetical protein
LGVDKVLWCHHPPPLPIQRGSRYGYATGCVAKELNGVFTY